MSLSKIENRDSKNSDDIISERECFEFSGPLHLTAIDWTNVDHRRSVAACLVQGVYIIERDRQENRQQSEALAPPWWNFFQFDLYAQLIDDADSCVFGAIKGLPRYTFEVSNDEPQPDGRAGRLVPTRTIGPDFCVECILATKDEAFHFARTSAKFEGASEVDIKALPRYTLEVSNDEEQSDDSAQVD